MSELPVDLEAERALLGALLIDSRLMGDVRAVLDADDFHVPNHKLIWTAMEKAWRRGQAFDVLTVADEVSAIIQQPLALLLELQNATPAVSRWAHYADLIVRDATRRRLIFAAAEVTEQAWQSDPFDVAARFRDSLASLHRPMASLPEGLMTADELADMTDADVPPWVVEHWLRQGDRAIIVAEEGVGKSYLTLQMAMAIAQGVNPLWTSHRFMPSTTLVVDLENPQHISHQRARRLRDNLAALPRLNYTPGLCSVWARPAGLNLRSRTGQRELESVLAEVRPSFVVIAPLYKALRKSAREDLEEVAAEVQGVLDDLRVRFGFTLVIEHHAPKGGSGVRDMTPFGSSLWLRWPEYGIGLQKPRDDPSGRRLHVVRFRGDRVKNEGWPSEFCWGDRLPWAARWNDVSPWAN